MEDFEEWETISAFTENEDWDGLVKWTKLKYEKNPQDHYYQYQYGCALIENKQYDQAIEHLTKSHKLDPTSLDITHSLLDALFASGKNEYDFQWKIEPIVLWLDNATLELCQEFLKGKKKHRSITDIYCDLVVQGFYLRFTEYALCGFLIESGLFDVLEAYIDEKYNVDAKFRNPLKGQRISS